ncbi:uncharacterized protein [Dysidea avara]|uniref:uncharacterized protein n=1 Tax=Dysidea avara TaxID=196820 RepID=UPI00332D2943
MPDLETNTTGINIDQPPSYPEEKPPAYSDVCPSSALTTTAPPSYSGTTPSQTNNSSFDIPPSPAVSSSAVPQSVVVSQPGTARPLRVIPYNQNHQYQSQNQADGTSTKERDIFGIVLIVVSFVAMILALPIGLHAFIWACAAYHTNERSQQKQFRGISILMNVISFVAIALVAVIVPITITQAQAMQP